MNYLLLTTAALVVTFSSCKQQQPAEKTQVFDFAKYYKISSSLDKTNNVFEVVVTMNPPLHAYAAGEKIGKPVALEIVAAHGWRADGAAQIPYGVKKALPGLSESVILEKSFSIRQKVIKGKGYGEAVLLLQVCTDNLCDQPRQHKLRIAQ